MLGRIGCYWAGFDAAGRGLMDVVWGFVHSLAVEGVV